MIHREAHVSDLKFPLHTEEKLEIIEYYYKIWFKIVNKRQKPILLIHTQEQDIIKYMDLLKKDRALQYLL